MFVNSRILFSAICLALGLSYFDGASRLQAQNNQPEPEQMFRQLDANQDGKITMDEQQRPGSREFAQRVFEMGKKPTTGSISREEFLRIAEQHRNGGRPQAGGPGVGRGPNAGPNGGPGAGQGGGPGAGGRPPRSNEGRPPLESDDTPPGFPPFLRGIDGNSDQRLSRAELARLIERFDEVDTNQDGDLDLAELSSIEGNPGNDGSPEAANDDTAPLPKAGKKPTPAKSKPEPRSGTSGKNAPGKNAPGKTPAAKNSGASSSPRTREPLSGIWRGWVVDGRGENPNAGHMEMELTVNGSQMTARELGENRRAQQGLGEGNFVVTAQGNAGNLDANQTAGQHAGRQYPGIFELNGDTLRWCVGGRGTTRPTAFETGRGNYLMVLHKQP